MKTIVAILVLLLAIVGGSLFHFKPEFLFGIDDPKGVRLHRACYFGNVSEVDKLHRSGSYNLSAGIPSADGVSCLIMAAERGHAELVKQLRRYPEVDINEIGVNRTTPLMRAAAHNQLQIVRDLLNYKAKVNTVDQFGRTALFFAASKGSIDVVKKLVEADADVNPYAEGTTPILEAVKKGRYDIVKQLCRNKKLDLKRNYYVIDHRTVLQHAIKLHHVDMIKLLISKPCFADVNGIREKDKMTPLHFAITMNSTTLVKILLEEGKKNNLDLNRLGGDKEKSKRVCPYFFAAQSGNVEILKILRQAGGKTDCIRKKDGITPFMITGMMGHDEAMRDIGTEDKVDLKTQKSKHGFSILYYLIGTNRAGALQVFKDLGGDIKEEWNGQNALELAESNHKNSEVAKLLRKWMYPHLQEK